MNKINSAWSYPETQEEAIALLRLFNSVGDTWHFDDDAREFYGEEEGRDRNALVERLNELFPNCGNCVNAGAWHAAELVNWAGVMDSEA